MLILQNPTDRQQLRTSTLYSTIGVHDWIEFDYFEDVVHEKAVRLQNKYKVVRKSERGYPPVLEIIYAKILKAECDSQACLSIAMVYRAIERGYLSNEYWPQIPELWLSAGLIDELDIIKYIR